MSKNQTEACRFDHSASKTPEEAARWCQMFHSPEAQAAEKAAKATIRTYRSDALGAVTIPED